MSSEVLPVDESVNLKNLGQVGIGGSIQLLRMNRNEVLLHVTFTMFSRYQLDSNPYTVDPTLMRRDTFSQYFYFKRKHRSVAERRKEGLDYEDIPKIRSFLRGAEFRLYVLPDYPDKMDLTKLAREDKFRSGEGLSLYPVLRN